MAGLGFRSIGGRQPYLTFETAQVNSVTEYPLAEATDHPALVALLQPKYRTMRLSTYVRRAMSAMLT